MNDHGHDHGNVNEITYDHEHSYDLNVSEFSVPDSLEDIVGLSNRFLYSAVGGDVTAIYITLVVLIAAAAICIILSLEVEQEEEFYEDKPVRSFLQKFIRPPFAILKIRTTWWIMITSFVLNILYYLGLRLDVIGIEYYVPLALSVHVIVFGYIMIGLIAFLGKNPFRMLIMYIFAFLAQTLSAIITSSYHMSLFTGFPKERTLNGMMQVMTFGILSKVVVAIVIGLLLRLIISYLMRDKYNEGTIEEDTLTQDENIKYKDIYQRYSRISQQYIDTVTFAGDKVNIIVTEPAIFDNNVPSTEKFLNCLYQVQSLFENNDDNGIVDDQTIEMMEDLEKFWDNALSFARTHLVRGLGYSNRDKVHSLINKVIINQEDDPEAENELIEILSDIEYDYEDKDDAERFNLDGESIIKNSRGMINVLRNSKEVTVN